MRGFQKYGGHFSEEKKGACGNVPTSLGLPKIQSHFSEKKKAPAATYPQVQGFQKYRGHFSEKKSACGNVPTSSGLPEIWPPWDSGRKTRFSNGLADNRSKVSVKKSEIGFVHINFSRSIFPYMSNIYENC